MNTQDKFGLRARQLKRRGHHHYTRNISDWDDRFFLELFGGGTTLPSLVAGNNVVFAPTGNPRQMSVSTSASAAVLGSAVSVLTYGTNAAAFNAAIAAAGANGTVIVPSTTYTGDGVISPLAGQTIFGIGDPQIKFTAAGFGFDSSAASGVTYTGIGVDSNNHGARNNVHILAGANTVVDRCKLQFAGQSAVAGAGVSGVRVTRCAINDIAQSAVSLTGTFTDATVTNNVLTNASGSGYFGVLLGNVDRAMVSQNIANSMGGGLISIGSGGTVRRVAVTGNVGYSLGGPGIYGTAGSYAADYQVSGNRLESLTGVGIELLGGGLISGNVVKGASSHAVKMAGRFGGGISSNLLDTAGGHGIYVVETAAGTITGVVVGGNLVQGTVQDGIVVAGTSGNVSLLRVNVTRNVIDGYTTTINGIRMSPNGTGTCDQSNSVLFNTIGNLKSGTGAGSALLTSGARVNFAGTGNWNTVA